jgi:hypothetical protein
VQRTLAKFMTFPDFNQFAGIHDADYIAHVQYDAHVV